jgi:hypothetical protein
MDKGKKRCFNHFWYLFQRQKIRVFAHLSKFEFYLLEESSIALEGYSALHKDSTRYEDHEIWD